MSQEPAGSWPDGIKLVSVDEVKVPTFKDEITTLIEDTRAEWAKETKGWGVYEWFGYYIPCLIWLRKYNWRSWLLWDVAAGLSTAAMVIPQGMSL